MSMNDSHISGGSKTKPSKKASNKTSKKSTSKSSSKKTGGSLANDLQNLSVPFALLLAKYGLENVFADKKRKENKENNKTSSKFIKNRTKTITGGEGEDVEQITGGKKRSKKPLKKSLKGGSCQGSCSQGTYAGSAFDHSISNLSSGLTDYLKNTNFLKT